MRLRTDTADVHRVFCEHDAASVERLVAIRRRVPDDPVDAQIEAPEVAGMNLAKFDGRLKAPSDLHGVPAAFGSNDLSKSAALIECLTVRLHRVPEPLQTELRTDLKGIDAEHRHAHRDYEMRLKTEAGFAIRRLRLAARQLNPRPGNKLSPELLDEYHRFIYRPPEVLREMARGAQPLSANDLDRVRDLFRNDVRLVQEHLLRRLESVRSREGLLETYRLRCEWYDATAVAALASSLEAEAQKEDRLAEHLALFLFDNGMRPLTRAMVGKLVPDLFESFPFEPSFYVEAKQYADKSSATKAIRDGARQIWSTAHRLSGRFQLDEAFLVICRRGGPLLRFEGPARTPNLAVKPILIDVAPAAQSGSRQKEIVDVPAVDLLAAQDADGTGR